MRRYISGVGYWGGKKKTKTLAEEIPEKTKKCVCVCVYLYYVCLELKAVCCNYRTMRAGPGAGRYS